MKWIGSANLHKVPAGRDRPTPTDRLFSEPSVENGRNYPLKEVGIALSSKSAAQLSEDVANQPHSVIPVSAQTSPRQTSNYHRGSCRPFRSIQIFGRRMARYRVTQNNSEFDSER